MLGDEGTALEAELIYRVIEELLIKFGRYPTREEVWEAVTVYFDSHTEPNVLPFRKA